MRDRRRRPLSGRRVAIVAAVLWTAACDSDPGGAPASSLAAGSSAASTTRTDPPAATTTPQASAAPFDLDEVVADFVSNRYGGVAVLVRRNGATTTAAAGVANAAGDPIAPAMAFRVGSISKPFVATMVLQLVDEGRIDLDEPLSTYLPDTPVGADVTIRALLSHRSGLPNYTDIDIAMSDALADPSRDFTPDDILGYVEAIPPGEPDQRFAYSNTNYILLGQLIERLDDTDLNTALRNRITGPLGLDATLFATADNPTPDGLVAGWSAGFLDGDPDAVYDSIASGAWAAGSLVSTVGELADFLTALFGGELISDQALTEMTSTRSEGNGLGLFAADFGPDQPAYGHNGGIPGFTSMMAVDPATGDTLVVVTNNDGLIADRLAGQILENW